MTATITTVVEEHTVPTTGVTNGAKVEFQKPPPKKDSNKVRVVARIRPMAKYEIENGSREIVKVVDGQVLEMSPPGSENRWFELDSVLDGDSTQESVYTSSGAQKAVTEDLFKGLNCTILAYGQTGAGKTFTMGTAAGCKEVSKMDGVIPRACSDLFKMIHRKCDGNAKVELSYLEIYNEEIRDLMADKEVPLRMRETLSGEVYVSGLEARSVVSAQEIGEYMEEASKRRVVASTKMNAVSSRSHAICVLRIQGVLEDFKFQSKLTLVDLAGSERIKKTGAQGNRRQEGININKGLFVLGQVVSALAEQRPKYKRKPPYRDSKLTRLLQDSLGGNSQTIMIACVSPADFNCDETINTLRYATSARNIQNTATRNVMKSISPEEAAKLERENQLLKAQVKELQEAIQKMTLEAFDAVSIKSFDAQSMSLGSCDDPSVMDEDDAKTKRIQELEKKVEKLKSQLDKAKVDIRKTAIASAVELPALKVQVGELEEELQEAEEVKRENEELWAELEAMKADASTARTAATKMSKLLEEIKDEKDNEMNFVQEEAEKFKEVAKDGHEWIITMVIILLFQVVLTTIGLAQVANHNDHRRAFEVSMQPLIEQMSNNSSCNMNLPDMLSTEQVDISKLEL